MGLFIHISFPLGRGVEQSRLRLVDGSDSMFIISSCCDVDAVIGSVAADLVFILMFEMTSLFVDLDISSLGTICFLALFSVEALESLFETPVAWLTMLSKILVTENRFALRSLELAGGLFKI